jgi:DNA-binding transcriptional LysR family regulator
LEIHDFTAQNFVSLAPNDPYRQIVDEMFRRSGVQRQLVVETHSAVSVCAMVRQGIGIGIVNPLTAWDFVGHGIHIRPLAVPIPFRVHVVRPLHRPGNLLVERFVTALREEVTALLTTFS